MQGEGLVRQPPSQSAWGDRFRRAIRRAWALAGASLLVVAPFQCPSEPDPTQVRQDSPGEALYLLAGEFAKADDKEARVRTLKYIVERYPRSRFATSARADLKELGVEMPEPRVAPDANRDGVPMGRLPGDPVDPGASATAASSASPAPQAP